MTSISLYTPTWAALGGGEKYILTLAEALSNMSGVAVTLLLSDRPLDKRQLESFFGVDLSKVPFKERIGASDDQDVFICLSNFRKIESSARTRVQLLQIPYGRIVPASVLSKLARGQLKETVKDVYRLRLLAYSRGRASLVITNSRFVRDTLGANFGIESHVLYPPIHDFRLAGVKKENTILSVGRFFAGLYNQKRYDILTEAFRMLHADLPDWEYHIVGSAGSDASTLRMLEELKSRSRDLPVYFHVNEPYASLQRLYNRTSVLWHAAGYGVDEERNPENVEHFGMTTVEAMSAGCIPLVINKGGQKEIIQQGVNGYLWNSVDELVAQTLMVARADDSTLAELRESARLRYRDFSLERFRQRVDELFSPFIASAH
jgi:glycosyltransferase involved in cell wall biosynthesis